MPEDRQELNVSEGQRGGRSGWMEHREQGGRGRRGRAVGQGEAEGALRVPGELGSQ